MRWKLLIAIVTVGLMLVSCAVDIGKDVRFGMYGGKHPEPKPEPLFDVTSTKWETRWFPAYVRWSPDDTHLLVSLCHVNRPGYCRIGKYWINGARWELLNLQPQVTYLWPSYSPDGKSIVTLMAGCDGNFVCDKPFALVLLSADGQRVTRLVETRAQYPRFSEDGKQIIYWRHTGGGVADVALFDLATAQEQMLTKMLFWSSDIRGPAYFLPGKRFLFAGLLNWPVRDPLIRHGMAVRRSNGALIYPSDPRTDTKFDPGGPLQGTLRYVATFDDVPVTRQNFTKLALLWPDGLSPNGSGALDVTKSGQVLYWCSHVCIERNVASRERGSTRKMALAMLRPANEAANDLGMIELTDATQQIAISNNERSVAFIENASDGWHFRDRFGIASRFPASFTFIDWPRLELDPEAITVRHAN